MPNEPLINEDEIDVTARPSGIKRIVYLPFDRYEVGFVEDEDQRVIGICSIKVVREFYDIDQMERGKFYWSPEDYDSPD